MAPPQTPPLCLFVVLCLFHLCPLSTCQLFSSSLEEESLGDSFRELREKEPRESRIESGQHFVTETNGFLPAGRELRAFVKFSAYRDSMTEFYVVGLASTTLRTSWGEPVTGCNWLPRDSTLREVGLVNTTPTIIPTPRNDQHGMEYIVLIVKCTFSKEVGGKDGGTLFLRVPRHKDHYLARVYGVDDMLPVLRETCVDPDLYQLEQNTDANDKRFRHKFAICGSPMRTNINATIFQEWILWHKGAFQDDIHFVVYIVEHMDKDLITVLEKFEDEKLVTIVHAEDQSLYEGWYFNQVLFVNDCIHRSRHVAKWALHIDYDEFLHVRSKFQNLPELFDHYKDAGALYFNRVDFSREHCLPQKSSGQWAMELRPFRSNSDCLDSGVHCDNNKFPKWAVNPYAVLTGQIHFVILNSTSGVELATVDENVAHIVHSRRIAGRGWSDCLFTVYNITDYPELLRDPAFTNQVTQLVEERQWQHGKV